MESIDKENLQTFKQIIDMFGNIEKENIKSICEQNNWKIENCIDDLIEMEKTAETKNQNCIKKSSRGATPKAGQFTYIHNSWDNAAPLNVEENILQQIRAGFRVMVLLRGAPGSGKSYLGRSLIEKSKPSLGQYSVEHFLFSTDDFFYDKTGRYRYCVEMLDKAHTFNHSRVREKTLSGWSPIFIDNTNLQLWEMIPYVKEAVQNGYIIEILEPKTPWRHSPEKLAIKNNHKVPREKIQKMLSKFEKGTVTDLLAMLKEVNYSIPLPQMRVYPPPATLTNFTDTKKTDEIILENLKMCYQNGLSSKSSSKDNFPESNLDNPTTKPSSLDQKLTIASKGSQLQNLIVNKSYRKEALRFSPVCKATTDVRGKLIKQKPSLNDIRKESINESATEICDDKNYNIDNIYQKWIRHSKACANENKSFALLRTIYSNKSLCGLWDLFVKYDGYLDWAVDNLLKDDNVVINKNTNNKEDESDFNCNCEKQNSDEVDMNIDAKTSIGIKNSCEPQSRRTLLFRKQSRITSEFKQISNDLKDRDFRENGHYSKNEVNIHTTPYLESNNSSKKKKNEVQTQTEFNDNELDNIDDLLEFSLGDDLINQLTSIFQKEFVFDVVSLPRKNRKVFIPRYLAKELYLWIESAYNETEELRQKQLREDEDFARLLQNPKHEKFKTMPENTQELLSLETARTLQQKEVESNQLESVIHYPKSLAGYLTQMKLNELFPTIPSETLCEIYTANNREFEDTIQILRHNTSNGNISKDSETLQHTIKRDMQASEVHKQKKSPNSNSNSDVNISELVSPQDAKKISLAKFEECRNMASHHSQMRGECYLKATNSIQKGSYQLASYYSDVANMHKKNYELFNQRAANFMMEVHKHSQNNPDLLDLHFLHTIEAIGCLDLFLDQHITKLRSESLNFKKLFIITGRGLHSVGGISAIKIKVRARLRERNLRWSEVNPGLLKVKIFAASRHSKHI